jgi:hypothetical protein
MQMGIRPVQIIPLGGCTVSLCPEEEFGRPDVFLVESTTWIKKGKGVNSVRVFYLQAPSLEQAEEWMFLIQVHSRGRQPNVCSTCQCLLWV